MDLLEIAEITLKSISTHLLEMSMFVCVQGGGGGEDRPGADQPVHPVLQGADRAVRPHQRGAAVQPSGRPGSADSLYYVVVSYWVNQKQCPNVNILYV